MRHIYSHLDIWIKIWTLFHKHTLILVPRDLILLASATDRELCTGPILESANRGLPVNCATAKFEDVWSDLIISDLILLYLISQSKQVCQSSRSVTLAKRIAILGTRTQMPHNASERKSCQFRRSLDIWDCFVALPITLFLPSFSLMVNYVVVAYPEICFYQTSW